MTDEEKQKNGEACIRVVIGTPASFCIAIYAAVVGQYLWKWFVLPVTHIEVPSLFVLAGLMMTTRFSVRGFSREPKVKSDVFVDTMFAVIYISLVWGFGALYSLLDKWLGW